MMWLVLTIVTIAVICLMVLQNRLRGDSKIEQSNDQYTISSASTLVDVDGEEDYLIAVIAAAIHEFTETGDFQVVEIKHSATIWTLTSRQNIVANR